MLPLAAAAAATGETLTGDVLLAALASVDANVPLDDVVPFFYDRAQEGWRRLVRSSRVDAGEARRIEVMLEAPAAPHRGTYKGGRSERMQRLREGAAAAVGDDEAGDDDEAADGYFGIGVYNSKSEQNVGTLWRSAYQLGCQFLFTVGTRYRHAPTDTVKVTQRLPLFELDDWNAFVEFAPRGARWVAVETGGVPLDEFEHPLDAVYILGSEDAGLPRSILRSCHDVVSLRAENYGSYNVAVAGSLVLYDRLQKATLRAEKKKAEKAAGKAKKKS